MSRALVMNNRFFIYTLSLVFLVSVIGVLFAAGIIIFWGFVMGVGFSALVKRVKDQFDEIDKNNGGEEKR